MPLRLNIAMSRKVGEPNYGSRGATVGLEMELDTNLLHQPKQLHGQITRLFKLARAAIERELEGESAGRSSTAAPESTVRAATANQVRAIQAIARRQDLDLLRMLRHDFQVERPEDLSLEQASQLIDSIKPSANGVADLPRSD